MAKVS